jgi:hypothetical protein
LLLNRTLWLVERCFSLSTPTAVSSERLKPLQGLQGSDTRDEGWSWLIDTYGVAVLEHNTLQGHAVTQVAFDMAAHLLPGQSAPVGVITSTDRSAVVLIATGIALVVGFVALGIRVFVRYTHSLSWDDYAIFAATVSTVPTLTTSIYADRYQLFSVFQSATVFIQGKNGLGKVERHIDASELVHLQKVGLAEQSCFGLFTDNDRRHMPAIYYSSSPSGCRNAP